MRPALQRNQRRWFPWYVKCLIACGLVPAVVWGALLTLRLFGIFRPFYVPYGSMEPAVSAGDHIVMERLTYHVRGPRRGDIVVFNSDHTGLPGSRTLYIKRVVGMPHDHVLISDGNLFIDDKLVTLSNIEGRIVYNTPTNFASFFQETNVTVPAGCYYLLGDNSTNSLDSRYFGGIPRKDILGRVMFCYWPSSRIGTVK
jgi:signal peptidase I